VKKSGGDEKEGFVGNNVALTPAKFKAPGKKTV
jgi:hypothetical protein